MRVTLRRPGSKAALLSAAVALIVTILAFASSGALGHAHGAARVGTPANAHPAAAAAWPISLESNACPREFGRLFTYRLPSSPFPHGARAKGYSYEGEDYGYEAHYDDPSVSVFVPADYSPGPSPNLVFFFHGWLSSRAKAASEFALIEQFKDSGARALLVIPETAKDAPDSFGGKLEDSGGFDRFVRDLLAALSRDGVIRSDAPGRMILAGHSGAYRVISKILAQGGLSSRVEEVYLFDALFGGEEEYRDWIVGGGKRFASILSDGGDTEERARALARSLEDSGVEATFAKDDPAEDAMALASRVVFITSPSDHYGVVHERNEFQRLLESSGAASTR